MIEQERLDKINTLIFDNVKILSRYYFLSTCLFIIVTVIHIIAIIGIPVAMLFFSKNPIENNDILVFLILNIALVIIELILLRVGFTIAARAGQLRDFILIITVIDNEINIENLEKIVNSFQLLLRRFQIFDIESLFSSKK